MRVKRYIVDSMPDALQKIRSELGQDAVILNTKEIKTGGFLGLFGKKRIEVIAAKDEGSASKPAAKPPTERKAAKVAEPSRPPVPTTAVPEERAEQDELIFTVPPVRNQAAQAYGRNTVSKPVERQADIAAPAGNSNPAAETDKAIDQRLMDEIRSMKEMVARLAFDKQKSDWAGSGLEQLERRLTDHEFTPEFMREILAAVTEQSLDRGEVLDYENAQAAAKQYLKELVQKDQIADIAPDTKIIHFVGPTGVGKTTTIAKLAAELALKHKKKVGFITSDTYRIAAVEQLKTYANILNVPLEVVFSAQEVSRAFDNLKDRDVVFMDTAGRNFKNEMFVSEVNSLLRSSQKSETYLVLSMTTKYRDMKVITNNFSKYQIDKVLFTKMDETDSYGAVFNLVRDFGFRLSYMTTGQNVPDDITKINIDELLDRIMEDGRDE